MEGNTATVVQEAADEDANEVLSIVTQTGSNNTATVTQLHTAVYHPVENQYTGPQGLVEAYVNQTGNMNDATQVQGQHNQLGNAWMLTDQSGDDNTAVQEQNSYNNEAFINQTGTSGVAKQFQDRGVPVGYIGATSNLAIIDQGGLENEAYQVQNGHANDAYAIQTGKDNYSHQEQGNDDGTSWVSYAAVTQAGKFSDASQTQVGKVNFAVINQTSGSESNSAMQDQTNTGGGTNPYHAANSAHILQTGGNGNIAEQTQTIEFDPTIGGGGLPAMYPNVGHIYQDGGANQAYQTQTGGNNLGYVVQTGNGNIANVTQSQSVVQPPN